MNTGDDSSWFFEKKPAVFVLFWSISVAFSRVQENCLAKSRWAARSTDLQIAHCALWARSYKGPIEAAKWSLVNFFSCIRELFEFEPSQPWYLAGGNNHHQNYPEKPKRANLKQQSMCIRKREHFVNNNLAIIVTYSYFKHLAKSPDFNLFVGSILMTCHLTPAPELWSNIFIIMLT